MYIRLSRFRNRKSLTRKAGGEVDRAPPLNRMGSYSKTETIGLEAAVFAR